MQIENTVLPSGLRVITAKLPAFDTVAVGAFVNTGSRYENDGNGGIAHFLEHMAFKGTGTRSALDIAREVECLGSSVNAYTSREMTAYFVTGLKDTIAASIAIIGDVLTNSRFAQADIDAEKNVVLQEIKRSFDNPSNVAGRYFGLTAYPDQAVGRPVLGTSAFIESVQRDHLTSFVDRFYTAENMVVIAAGNVDHATVCDLVHQHFGDRLGRGTPATPEPAKYVGGQHRDTERDFQQVTLFLGLQSVPETHPDVYAHEMLASVLGGGMSSPLFQEVREKRGLVYAVGASSEQGPDRGTLNVYAGTTADKVEELLKVACGEIVKSAHAISDQDVTRARNTRLVQLATTKERPFSIMQGLAWSWFTFGRLVTPEEEMARVSAVTMDDIKAAAASVIRTAPTLSMVGPLQDADYLALVRGALAH